MNLFVGYHEFIRGITMNLFVGYKKAKLCNLGLFSQDYSTQQNEK